MHKRCVGENAIPVNANIILGTYMIVFYPEKTFESLGPMEAVLFESAKSFLSAFDAVVSSIRVSRRLDSGDVFESSLAEYLRRFKEWKIPDEKKLVIRLKHALMALYRASDDVEGHLDMHLMVAFRTQIEKINQKFKQIAGEAAFAEFEEQRRVHGVHETMATWTAHFHSRMTSEQMAHELLYDPNFRLSDEEDGVFRNAFWAGVIEEMQLSTPVSVRLLRVFADICFGITEYMPGEVPVLEAMVDRDQITQYVAQGNWAACFDVVTSVASVIQRIQVPRRAPQLTAAWIDARQRMLASSDHPTAFCNGVRFLLDWVGKVRVDAANQR